jgi:hypothetical protein
MEWDREPEFSRQINTGLPKNETLKSPLQRQDTGIPRPWLVSARGDGVLMECLSYAALARWHLGSFAVSRLNVSAANFSQFFCIDTLKGVVDGGAAFLITANHSAVGPQGETALPKRATKWRTPCRPALCQKSTHVNFARPYSVVR